jgi:hypothetical protein
MGFTNYGRRPWLPTPDGSLCVKLSSVLEIIRLRTDDDNACP